MSRGPPSERVSDGVPDAVLAHTTANATILVAITEALPELRARPASRTVWTIAIAWAVAALAIARGTRGRLAATTRAACGIRVERPIAPPNQRRPLTYESAPAATHSKPGSGGVASHLCAGPATASVCQRASR